MAKITLPEDVAKQFELVGNITSDMFYAGSNNGNIILSKLTMAKAESLVAQGCTLLKKKETPAPIATKVPSEPVAKAAAQKD